MKRKFWGVIALVCALFVCSCSSEMNELVNDNPGYVTVNFNVTGIRISQVQTRASLSDAFSMLELALYVKNDDGSYTKYKEVDQASSAPAFGAITLENVKCGSYKLIAIGHNDKSHPDIDDPTDIAFSNYPNAYSYSSDIEITKTTSTVDVAMAHVSAKLMFNFSGYIPEEVDHLQFTIDEASNTFNAITGYAASTTTRVVDVPVSEAQRTNKSWTGFMYTFLTSDELTAETSDVKVTISGLDANNNVLETKTFESVPVKIGYETQFSGTFFEYGGIGFNLTVNTNWGSYASLTF